jgi:DNA-binding CsgD family transcriptional regulator
MVRSYPVTDAATGCQRLCDIARQATSAAAFRETALALLAGLIEFDAALFHELSPRVPLERAASIGLELAALEAGRDGWDENAVLFGRLRELALAQDGVVTDSEAFPAGSRARKAWQTRVERPLRVRTLLMGHLLVQERILSAVLLFRRSARGFSARDQACLRGLLPALALGDALHQALEHKSLSGPPAQLRCVDQRLTARQREIVERVALGHTNAQIGSALGLSENTVRNLLTEARRRLGAANRAEIVRVAVLR